MLRASSGEFPEEPALRIKTSDRQSATSWAWHLAAATGYGANWRGAEHLAHGPALWAMVGRRKSSIRIGGFIAGRYLLPVEPEASNVVVRLSGFELRIGGALEFALTRRIALAFGAGLGVDEMQIQPRTRDDTKRALPGGWDQRGVATAWAGVQLPTRIGTVFLLGELIVPLQQIHYDLHRVSGPRDELISSPVLHPGLTLMMHFDTSPS